MSQTILQIVVKSQLKTINNLKNVENILVHVQIQYFEPMKDLGFKQWLLLMI